MSPTVAGSSLGKVREREEKRVWVLLPTEEFANYPHWEVEKGV